MPAKGASGATTIACNLAFQCKRLGAEDPAGRSRPADRHSFLRPETEIDLLLRGCNPAEGFARSRLVEADDDDVCKGSGRITRARNACGPSIPNYRQRRPIIEFAQSMYEAVILDCGGVYGAWNMSIARLADEVFC